MSSQSRKMRGLHFFGHGGGKPEGKEGGGNSYSPARRTAYWSVPEHDETLAQTRRRGLNNTSMSEDVSYFMLFENDEHSERELFEFAYDSEINGDVFVMFNN